MSEGDIEKILQTFLGPVGQVAGGNIENHTYHAGGRELTKQERIDLNVKVKRLEAEYEEPGWKTWKFLHRTIGIENIEAMRLGQQNSAHAILDLLLENASLQSRVGIGDDRARNLAEVAIQNGNLTAQLREAKEKSFRLERMLSEETRLSASLRTRLDNTCGLVEENNQKLAGAKRYWQELDGKLHIAHKRGRRRLFFSLAFGSLAIASSAFAYYQNARATAADARLSACAYAGKAYAIGSILSGSSDRECVRTKEGRYIWQPVVQKPKRSGLPKPSRPESNL